jgi:DNA-binding transcriptional MerR regulator
MTLAARLADEPALDDSADTAAARDALRDSGRTKSADAFRTIGEAAAELGLKTHVLRFWETKFPELKPMKRPDGRRFYRPEDMAFLRMLQELLHVRGLTIRGAIKVIRDKGVDGALADDAWQSGELETESEAPLAEAGMSVLDLQATVREAVERGDFVAAAQTEGNVAKARLESLLADLTDLKSRLDSVRAAG